MRIVCPACTATYEVPTDLLKPGRTVRCARCAGEWVPSAEAEDLPSPPLVAEPEPIPVVTQEPRAPVERPPPEPVAARRTPAVAPGKGTGALRLAWIASVVVLGALVWGAYSQRAAVMQAWPPSIRMYAVLGLADGQ